MLNQNLLSTDLSVWGMFQHADIVVKVVMVGLLTASVITWAIFFSKYSELTAAKRRLKVEQLALQGAKTLNQAAAIAEQFSPASHCARLIAEAVDERVLSEGATDKVGTQERTVFRMDQRMTYFGRYAARGNGFLATIGSVAPFVGLFGTVWGIMNSFIGIATTQTTNLAVVAPGIAEALLATAVGLVAAIPAVVIYNSLVRMIANYKASLGDTAAQIILLQGRDFDLGQEHNSAQAVSLTTTHKLRAG